MKLIEALEIVRSSPRRGKPQRFFLACGFTPLHLKTFLHAELCRLLGGEFAEVETGLFGDLAGNLGRLAEPGWAGGALVIEWPDIEPRLGLRSLGGWRPRDLPDILKSARARIERIGSLLELVARRGAIAVCLPTLPLPPVGPAAGREAGVLELELSAAVASMASSMTERVRIVSPQRLDQLSPAGDRFDVRSEIASGFPYGLSHASIVAEQLALLLAGPPPKKGLITDLDDTLWKGILGEVGTDGVAWDLDRGAQMHGVYQQLLASLGAAGVLIGVVSKNDPTLVEEAFAKRDMILPRDCVYPLEAHWGAKSGSVAKILRAWNIGPDSVVYVDDSPMELAEVQQLHPEISCLRFPNRNSQEAWELLAHLRDLFGKTTITEEDLIRLESLRAAGARGSGETDAAGASDGFLEQAEAVVVVSFAKDADDQRALELVNKTNQFNLNGRRYRDAPWRARLDDPARISLRVTYRDKYGPLGKIAILSGTLAGDSLIVDTWVMSCRAFSRRIEHQCLRQLYEKLGVGEIIFDFEPTDRNGPLQGFLKEMALNAEAGRIRLGREEFLGRCPALFHRVEEDPGG